MDFVPELASTNATQEVWSTNYPDCPVALKSTQNEIKRIDDLDLLVNGLASELQHLFGLAVRRSSVDGGVDTGMHKESGTHKNTRNDLPSFIYSPLPPDDGQDSAIGRRIKELMKCTSESVVEQEISKLESSVEEKCVETYRSLNQQVWSKNPAKDLGLYSNSKTAVVVDIGQDSGSASLQNLTLTRDLWLKSGAMRRNPTSVRSISKTDAMAAEEFGAFPFNEELGCWFVRSVIDNHFKIPAYWCIEVHFVGVLADDHHLAVAARRSGKTGVVSLKYELLHYVADFSLPTRRRPIPRTSMQVTFVLAVDTSDDDAIVEVLYRIGSAGGGCPTAFFNAREMLMRERWLVQALEVREAAMESVKKFWNGTN